MGSAKRKRQQQQQHQNQQQQRKKKAAAAKAAAANAPDAPLLSPELAAELGIEEGGAVVVLPQQGKNGGGEGLHKRRRDGRGQVVEDEVGGLWVGGGWIGPSGLGVVKGFSRCYIVLGRVEYAVDHPIGTLKPHTCTYTNTHNPHMHKTKNRPFRTRAR